MKKTKKFQFRFRFRLVGWANREVDAKMHELSECHECASRFLRCRGLPRTPGCHCDPFHANVPFRVRVHTITLSVHLNDPFWLQTQTGTRIQRAVLPTSAR